MSSPVAISSRCPSTSRPGSTSGQLCRSITSTRRPWRSRDQPAPAPKTAATWPPDDSYGTRTASNCSASPRSCSRAPTASSSRSGFRPSTSAKPAAQYQLRTLWATSAGVRYRSVRSWAARTTALSGGRRSSGRTVVILPPPSRARRSVAAVIDVALTSLAPDLLDYHEGWALQRRVHADVVAGARGDSLILCEHQAVFTAGKRTAPDERPED